jgi:preprotein translocase subunit SecE
VSSSTRTDASDARPPRSSKATARRGGGGPAARLSRFFREVVAELGKVIWPTRKELVTYTAVVIVFVSIMCALVTGLDIGFGKLVTWVFA